MIRNIQYQKNGKFSGLVFLTISKLSGHVYKFCAALNTTLQAIRKLAVACTVFGMYAGLLS